MELPSIFSPMNALNAEVLRTWRFFMPRLATMRRAADFSLWVLPAISGMGEALVTVVLFIICAAVAQPRSPKARTSTILFYSNTCFMSSGRESRVPRPAPLPWLPAPLVNGLALLSAKHGVVQNMHGFVR